MRRARARAPPVRARSRNRARLSNALSRARSRARPRLPPFPEWEPGRAPPGHDWRGAGLAGEWRPTPTALLQTIDNLRALSSPADGPPYRRACKQLDAYEGNPEVTPTLAFVFAKSSDEIALAASKRGGGGGFGSGAGFGTADMWGGGGGGVWSGPLPGSHDHPEASRFAFGGDADADPPPPPASPVAAAAAADDDDEQALAETSDLVRQLAGVLLRQQIVLSFSKMSAAVRRTTSTCSRTARTKWFTLTRREKTRGRSTGRMGEASATRAHWHGTTSRARRAGTPRSAYSRSMA